MTSKNYGARFLAAVERAKAVTSAADITVAERKAEIIDLTLQGLTVEELRAIWVAHLSGQPLPRGASRAAVVDAVRTAVRDKLLQSTR